MKAKNKVREEFEERFSTSLFVRCREVPAPENLQPLIDAHTAMKAQAYDYAR